LTKAIVAKDFCVKFVKSDVFENFKADIMITHRAAIRTPSLADRFLTHRKRTGAMFIYDLDDDLVGLPEEHPDHAYFQGSVKDIIFRFIAEADELWTATPSLADRFVGIAQRIEVIPNELDDRVWKAPRDPNPQRSNTPVRFVYIGTHTHRPDFELLIQPALTRLRKEFDHHIEFDLIGITGVTPSEEFRTVEIPPAVAGSYPAFSTWIQSLSGYDVGVAPLVDNEFNRRKSNLKWLEYSAMGLASIASDLPTYNQAITHGRTGLLVPSDVEHFYDAMRQLVVDRALRRTLQTQATRLVADSIGRAPFCEPRLARLRELADGPRGAEDWDHILSRNIHS
jgi:glycosyltransferase involved in cell wall biosynthesis